MLRKKGLVTGERRGDKEQRGQWPEGSAEAGDHGSELLSVCVVVHFFSSYRYGVTDGTLGPPEAGDGRVAMRADPVAQNDAGEGGRGGTLRDQAGLGGSEAGKIVMTLEEREGSQVEAQRRRRTDAV